MSGLLLGNITMNDDELLRYSRHILLQDFDYEKQQKLIESKVLIVGAGGLGCPVALYLASSGVGEITILDDDCIELSNLQRQIAYRTDQLGQSKAICLQALLQQQNPLVKVNAENQRLSMENAHQFIGAVDLVIDCTDNFTTRFLINRVCLESRKPFVMGAAQAFEGQVSLFKPCSSAPCYACLYPQSMSHSEMNCANSGILAPLVGVIGSLQALLAIKWLVDLNGSDTGKLFVFDAFASLQRQFTIPKDPHCKVCSQHTVHAKDK